MNQREGSGNALGWRDILVLAVEVVLPAELARSSFITFLLSRTTVVTGLGGAPLLSLYLLLPTAGGGRHAPWESDFETSRRH